MLSSLDLKPKYPSTATAAHHVFSKLQVVHVKNEKNIRKWPQFGYVNMLFTLFECCTSYEKWVLNYEENGWFSGFHPTLLWFLIPSEWPLWGSTPKVVLIKLKYLFFGGVGIRNPNLILILHYPLCETYSFSLWPMQTFCATPKFEFEFSTSTSKYWWTIKMELYGVFWKHVNKTLG